MNHPFNLVEVIIVYRQTAVMQGFNLLNQLVKREYVFQSHLHQALCSLPAAP